MVNELKIHKTNYIKKSIQFIMFYTMSPKLYTIKND